MNYWKYITIIMIGIGMAACQSQTDQTPATPEETTAPETTQHTGVQPAIKTPVPVTRTSAKKSPDTAHTARPTSPVSVNTANRVVSKPKTVTVPPKAEASAPAIKRPASVKVDMKALNKCRACHSLAAKAKVGPGLGKGNDTPGVFNRKAGAFPGFRYKFTKYIDGNGWDWDEAHLREWICDSKKALRKFTGDAKARTKMPPQRICNPAKQDAVIAALRSIS